jgi:pyruvate/2-oxoglutarate dehydrogenase complex dihydrolipoamide acyltransferase (E2) component
MAHDEHRRDTRSTYDIAPWNRFFAAICSISEYEFRPGHTVNFLAEVDLTEVERIRAEAPGERRPSYTAFVAKAVALSLQEFPYANSRVCWRPWLPFWGYRLQRFKQSDVAVAAERNVPGAEAVAFADVLRDADRLSLDEITRWLDALAASDERTNEQWRQFSQLIARLPNWLSALLIRMPYFFEGLWAKYRGGAVLISSPAKYGVDVVAGTWSWPLGISFGLVRPRPLVRDGQVVPRPTFMLSMNFDRRVMAGAQSARFFKRIVDLLEHPPAEPARQPTPVNAEAPAEAFNRDSSSP